MDQKKLAINLPNKKQVKKLIEIINKDIEELIIHSDNIKDETMEVLVDWLTNSKINKLAILGQFNLSILVGALRHPGNKLEVLRMNKSNIKDEGVTILAKALEDSNCNLTSLDLYYNNIGDKGAKELAGALKHSNNKLTSLGIYGNKIGDEGVRSLAEALRHPDCKLTSLDLSHTQIGDEGVKELAEALRSCNNKLTILRVHWSQFGDEGMVILAEALIDPNCKLTFLGVSGNKIGDEGVTALADILTDSNNKLISLEINWNKFGDRGMAKLKEALVHSNNRLEALELDAPEGGIGELAGALDHPNCKVISLLITHRSSLTKKEEAEALSKSLKMCKLKELQIFGGISAEYAQIILNSIVFSRLENLFLLGLPTEEIEEKLILAKCVRVLLALLSDPKRKLPIELLRKLKYFLMI